MNDNDYKSYIEYSKNVDYEGFYLIQINSYRKEFGDRKFKKVVEKVFSSNKINSLISTLKFHGIVPDAKEILACLNEIPFFIFSRGQTQAVAGLIVLQKWNEEANFNNIQFSNGELKAVAQMILDECKPSSF